MNDCLMGNAMKYTTKPALVASLLLTGGCAAAPMLTGSVLQGTGLNNLMPNSTARQNGTSQAPEVVGVDSEMPEILQELGQGKKVNVDSVMSDDVDGDDAALAWVERGRVAQLSGDPARSVTEFKQAVTKIKEFEDRAKVSASDIGSHAAALVVNDTMIPYEPAGFEKVMVYHFQALNYLMQGDIEAAGVEVRRANAEQALALKAHEEELRKAQNEAKEKGFKPSDFTASLSEVLGSSRDVAAQVKNSFQNAYTFYASAVIHELSNEPNDAYIDYKKALEIAPNNSMIQRDVARLAQQLGMGDDIAKFSPRFPEAFAATKSKPASNSEVIVFFEDGLVPEKSAISFPIPIPIPSAPGLTAVSIPTFKASKVPSQPLTLQSNGAPLAQSEQICAIDALAVKAFEESAPAMITRQVIRSAIKGTAAAMASKHGGGLAGAAVSLYNTLTEQADTRSWRSLPHNAQVLRANVTPGQTLELVHPATGLRQSVTVTGEAGKKTVVRASRVGSQLFVQSVTL